NSGTLRVELSDLADGEVSAGPVRVEGGNLPATPPILQPGRDAQGNYVQATGNGYAEQGAGWQDLKYPTGSGNFPLWESALLRPAFRKLFVDWQNGDRQFPDLGDPTSPDPNQVALTPSGSVGSFVSPFDPLPASPAPLGMSLVVHGNTVLSLPG